jgi:hypothetical protein
VYEHYEDAVTIGVYDDHAASAGSDHLVYAYLCDGCAGERNGDVTHLSTLAAGWPMSCESCGCPNRDDDDDEEDDDEDY